MIEPDTVLLPEVATNNEPHESPVPSKPAKYIAKVDYVNNVSIFNGVRFIFEIGKELSFLDFFFFFTRYDMYIYISAIGIYLLII